MTGHTEPPHTLLERRRNVGQEILELPVVQLTLSQRIVLVEKSSAIFREQIEITSTTTENNTLPAER